MPKPLRVFLVGMSEGFARALARYVRREPCITLIGAAPSLDLAGLLVPVTDADVVLLDWAVVATAARAGVGALRGGSPRLRIVCVEDGSEPYRVAAASAGADAVISRDGFAIELESLLPAWFPERFRMSEPPRPLPGSPSCPSSA